MLTRSARIPPLDPLLPLEQLAGGGSGSGTAADGSTPATAANGNGAAAAGVDGGPAPAGARPASTRGTSRSDQRAARDTKGGSLPFTGFALLTLVLLGFASTAMGSRLRDVLETAPPTPHQDVATTPPAPLAAPAPAPADRIALAEPPTGAPLARLAGLAFGLGLAAALAGPRWRTSGRSG
ncbi:MAG TPA: hypothetical protein VF520_11230 [Thermoleophilaceae bacterium]